MILKLLEFFFYFYMFLPLKIDILEPLSIELSVYFVYLITYLVLIKGYPNIL